MTLGIRRAVFAQELRKHDGIEQVVFKRMQLFSKRCAKLSEFFAAVDQFSNLAQVATRSPPFPSSFCQNGYVLLRRPIPLECKREAKQEDRKSQQGNAHARPNKSLGLEHPQSPYDGPMMIVLKIAVLLKQVAFCSS